MERVEELERTGANVKSGKGYQRFGKQGWIERDAAVKSSQWC
jgi:hypothetical protein